MFILRTARSAASSFALVSRLSRRFSRPLVPLARRDDGRPGPRARDRARRQAPWRRVAVVLLNDISGHRQEARTGADGTYLLYNVPPNPYHLTVEVQGFQPFHADVDVRGSAPVVKDVALSLAGATAAAVVHGDAEAVELESDTSMTHIDIDKSLIRQSPAAIPGRAFESIVTSTPGFSQDENGRYHFQGGHSPAAPRHRRAADRRPDRHHVLEFARPQRRRGDRDHHGRNSRGVRREGERRHQPHDALRPRHRGLQG